MSTRATDGRPEDEFVGLFAWLLGDGDRTRSTERTAKLVIGGVHSYRFVTMSAIDSKYDTALRFRSRLRVERLPGFELSQFLDPGF